MELTKGRLATLITTLCKHGGVDSQRPKTRERDGPRNKYLKIIPVVDPLIPMPFFLLEKRDVWREKKLIPDH